MNTRGIFIMYKTALEAGVSPAFPQHTRNNRSELKDTKLQRFIKGAKRSIESPPYHQKRPKTPENARRSQRPPNPLPDFEQKWKKLGQFKIEIGA